MITKQLFILPACLLLTAVLLPCPSARANISGFGNTGVGFTQNQSTSGLSVSNNVVTLTDGQHPEANSIFFNQKQQITAFTAAFTYLGTGTADGITLTLENDPRGLTALGDNGGALAYGGNAAILNSASVQLNLFGGPNTGFGTNGAVSHPNTFSNNGPVSVLLNYNGITLTEQLTDQSGMTALYSYPVNLATVVGGNTAYVGFTGSTGLFAATQQVSNFTFNAVPEPSTWAVMCVGAGLLLVGVRRRLTVD